MTAVGSSTVARLRPDGSVAPGSPITEDGLNHPMGIAVDSSGYLWVANSGLIDLPCPTANPSFASRGGSLTLIGRDGRPVRSTAFEGGGLTIPWGITVDGDDHVWVANFGRQLGRQRVSEFCGMRPATCPPGVDSGEPISPDGTGYGFDGLTRNTAVAIRSVGQRLAHERLEDRPGANEPERAADRRLRGRGRAVADARHPLGRTICGLRVNDEAGECRSPRVAMSSSRDGPDCPILERMGTPSSLWATAAGFATLLLVFLAGCGRVDTTPEKIDGTPSYEFERADLDRAEGASDAVKEYCADAVSEAQRLGCESHVTEDDIPWPT